MTARERLIKAASGLSNLVDAWRYSRRRYTDPIAIHPYRGHGTPDALFLRGRVLEEPRLRAATRSSRAWRNLTNMWRRFESDEVPGARLRARYGEVEREVVADAEGFFDVRLDLPAPPEPGRVWLEVELTLTSPETGPRATGHVLVPREADFAVVSDLDDTVIRTNVTDLLAMARVVLLGNAHTRLPFEGVAAFYRGLRAGPTGRGYNPIFYVSSGPWNLHDLITDFLDLNGIPAGPLFLRDWGLGLLAGHGAHKLEAIRRLLLTYPGLSFVLVGDSGERDPEIYRQVVLEHPGRIRAVYIRDVTSEARHQAVRAIAAELEAQGVPMLLEKETVSAARHALALGLVAPDAVPEVREERAEEVASPTPKQQLASGEPQGRG